MSLHLAPLLQAAGEYGAVSGAVASRVANLAGTVADSARDAWRVVAAEPMLLGGLFVVVILAALIMRNPAR